VTSEPKDPLDPKELRAFKGYRACKAKRVQGPQGPQGAPGEKGAKGDKGDKGDAAAADVPRAVQADGSVACEANETLVSVFCPSGGAPDGAKCGTSPTVGLCLKKP
jgi:hypothetical protein